MTFPRMIEILTFLSNQSAKFENLNFSKLTSIEKRQNHPNFSTAIPKFYTIFPLFTLTVPNFRKNYQNGY
jgi:hypothetical protein